MQQDKATTDKGCTICSEKSLLEKLSAQLWGSLKRLTDICGMFFENASASTVYERNRQNGWRGVCSNLLCKKYVKTACIQFGTASKKTTT